ncbi:MAG: hypothetical protein NT069_17430 [Planctomycetota bacterium]|nr:hypothetical protein [Planctomycetota bacterium]
MAVTSRNFLLKKRTWLVTVLAAGVFIGSKFPGLWRGFGGGGEGMIPFGTSGPAGEGNDSTDIDSTDTDATDRTESDPVEKTASNDENPPESEPSVVTVVISERSFLLRSPDEERSITTAKVVDLVKRAIGDADGIRLRIIRDPSSRPSAETALQTALAEGGIGEEEILWVPATGE